MTKLQLICILYLFWAIIFSPDMTPAEDNAAVQDQVLMSQSSPVVQANILYSGSHSSGKQTTSPGHVTATTIYDPVDPGDTVKIQIWDAGEVLTDMDPADRKIYLPDIRVIKVNDFIIARADGSTRTFSGTLLHPVMYSTVRITDGRETFSDLHIKELTGDLGGKGSINRSTGAFQISFNETPQNGVIVTCNYSYYVSFASLLEFDKDNIASDFLGMDDTLIGPGQYLFDLDGNGIFDEADADFLVGWVRGYQDGVEAKKKWLLGGIDHSVPAFAGPPGRPHWYYGTDINKDERDEFDAFLDAQKEKRSVLYVGAADGMLHAFDAGIFCWGDNPETLVIENRGFFKWSDLTSDPFLNDQWKTLIASNPNQPNGSLWQTTGRGDKAPDYGSGRELWAFIPSNILPRLKNNLLDAEDNAVIDASPAIADVCINGTWATVLISAEGSGGESIFCLDITDPERPRFLWEYSDPDIFRGSAWPSTAHIGKIAVAGIKRWAAFFASGDAFCADLDPSIYILDIADGSVIGRVFLHAGLDRNGDSIDDGKGSIACAQPAVIDSDGNGYIDRVYVGTEKGFMFKINIPDDLKKPQCAIDWCLINTDFSYKDSLDVEHSVAPDQQFQPIIASPSVVVDNDYGKDGVSMYNIRLFFGTSPGDQPARFFSYADHNPKGICNADAVTLEWFFQLPKGNVIVNSPVSAAGSVYLGTSTDGAADAGEGRIYSYDMASGKVLFEKEVGDVTASVLVEDEHLFIKTASSAGIPIIMGGKKYNNDTVKILNARAGVRAWKEIW